MTAVRRAVAPVVLVVMFVAGLVLVVTSSGDAVPDAVRVGPAGVAPPAGRVSVPLPLAAAATTRLRVPSIGLDSGPPIRLDLQADHSLQVPPDAHSVGWYDRAASPGENGPAVYAAHIDWKGDKGPFWSLRKVEAGDEVIIDRADGVTVDYTVDRVDLTPKSAFPTDAVYGPTVDPEVRLITCGGSFDRSARSYRDNVLVYGHAVEAYRTP